jgi:hypothetical protein
MIADQLQASARLELASKMIVDEGFQTLFVLRSHGDLP